MRFQFSNGNQIINRYAADGRKLGTEYFTKLIPVTIPINKDTAWTYSSGLVNQSGTIYIDNKEYNTFNGNSSFAALQRIYNSEGFVDTISATIPNYKYYRRDHLGNNREVWVANTKKTLQRTQYYPSGLPWASNTGDNPGQQERKYNGKEFIEMDGYDTYDYGARGYYPALGRFTSMDPHAEKYYSISPYAYCSGNPVSRIDSDGESWEPFDVNGNTVKINDYDNIHSYRWVDYDTDKNGNQVARANTVETAYTFGVEGMTTLSSEGYKPHMSWQTYGEISTGDTRADNNIASLDPRIQNQMKAVVLELRLRYGIDVKGGVQGGFRTYAEQDAIYARGASKAKGGQSNHNFAIAMDVAIYENNKYLDKGTEWQYTTYGKVAKKQGLMWGGDWKSFFDPAHIEYKHNLKMKQLRALPRDENGFLLTLP